MHKQEILDQNDLFLDRLKAAECPDATFPARSPALVFAKGLGSEVWDVAGRRYVDLCAGFGVLALGHNHETFIRTITSVAEHHEVVHGMGDVHPSAAKVELIERLTQVVPGKKLTRAALALTGAQAVELAAKTAMLATRKCGFITLTDGYHGLDLGILPLTARPDFSIPFQGWLPQNAVERVTPGAPLAVLMAAKARLDRAVAGVAAVVVEPIQGRAGGRSLGTPWLRELRRFCDLHGILLIYDEVFTGLGRSGRVSFAAEVPCDLLCLGKALGGGMPISACLGTESAMNAWPESRGEAIHTGTFFGHPLSCRVALATLTEIERLRLPERAATIGNATRRSLAASMNNVDSVATVRGEGLMIVVEFKKAGDGARAMDLLRARGIIALASGARGESLSLTPALNIPEPLLEEGVVAVSHVARALCGP